MTKILYENGAYWVAKAPIGYEVYETKLTHSVRCASIGWDGDKGLQRAIAEADRRAYSATVDSRS